MGSSECSSTRAPSPDVSSSTPSSSTSMVVKPRVSKNSRIRYYYNKPDTKCKRRGRNTGKLAQLMDMPLDVFFEITSHLRPADLLQLSRASKHFRDTFLSKQSRLLWISARKNASDIPPPPPCLSEPKYAALLFEHCCIACGVGRSPKVDHSLSVRFCGACWKANVCKGKALLKQYNGAKPLILTLIPHEIHKYSNVEPKINGEWDVYYAPEFEAVWNHYSSLSEAERPAYVEERRRHTLTMHEHAKVVAAWESKVKRKQSEEEENARKSREESIEEKLFAMGYLKTDFPPSWHPNWSSLVNQPRPLTARIWKQIEPKLIQAINIYREQLAVKQLNNRLMERFAELLSFYKPFLDTLPRNIGPIPTYTQLRGMELVKSMLRENDAQIPVTQERFDAVVPDEIKRFAEECTEDVIEHVLEKKIGHAKAHHEIAHQNFDLEPDDPYTPSDIFVRRVTKDETEAVCSALRQPDLIGSIADVRSSGVDLEAATSLFNCAFCANFSGKPGPPALYSFTELAEHIRDRHMTPYHMVQHKDKLAFDFNVYACTEAERILRVLGLPADTKYTDVNQKVACMCASPKLEQPATFSKIIEHIRKQRILSRCRTLGRVINIGVNEVLHDPHGIDVPEPCVKLIPEGGTFPTFTLQPLLFDFPQYGSVACKCCVNLLRRNPYEYSHAWYFNTLEDIVYHIRTIHRREPTQDDLKD